jgi:hypothetical protein
MYDEERSQEDGRAGKSDGVRAIHGFIFDGGEMWIPGTANRARPLLRRHVGDSSRIMSALIFSSIAHAHRPDGRLAQFR